MRSSICVASGFIKRYKRLCLVCCVLRRTLQTQCFCGFVSNGNRYKTNVFLCVPIANATNNMLGNWQRQATITYSISTLSIETLRFKIAITHNLASVYAYAIDALATY